MWYMTSHTRTVAAPLAAVWAVLSDVREWPTWLPTVDSLEPLDPAAPDGVGAAYRIVQPRLRPAVWTLTSWQPEGSRREFTWESRQPGVTTVGSHLVTTTPDGGSELTLGIAVTGPMGPVVRALYGRLTARYLAAEAEALAQRVARHVG